MRRWGHLRTHALQQIKEPLAARSASLTRGRVTRNTMLADGARLSWLRVCNFLFEM